MEKLVQSVDFGGNTRVDGALANFDNETTENGGVDNRNDLELLALAVLGLANGGLNTAESLCVEFLFAMLASCQSIFFHRQGGGLVRT